MTILSRILCSQTKPSRRRMRLLSPSSKQQKFNYLTTALLFLVLCVLVLDGHDVPVKNKPKEDKDHPDEEEIDIEDDDEHVDWEPVIEFPDNEGGYKERPQTGYENLQEEGHWQLHKIVNAIIHKEIQTEGIIEDMSELAYNGSQGGSMMKPYKPLPNHTEKVRQEELKKARKEKKLKSLGR